MEYKGSEVYEHEKFFTDYLKRRHREESPNNIIESPVIVELMGDVTGEYILDLGCGDAGFGRELFQQGCSGYEGVEGSANMVEKAREMLNGTNGKVHHSSMETWDFPEARYDKVVSRLALHYLAELGPVFKQVNKTLKANGKFIFSVQHPILTSSIESASQSSQRTNWIVDEYFHIGKRVEPWIEKEVIKYHRTVEEYFKLLKSEGFSIDEIRECSPQKENFKSEQEYMRRMRIPLFLVFACSKSAV
ncbi:class I SAM-dependent DNA methyltransferase [Neobacillus vireti]|uniref:Ubiquinone/menaquinone biosynthesis methyltransferase UbiE n=1 Tax=Neobacillus vireti LMG 21834 TaxID=1131730 RepID=A0AB94IUV1_9BACI|nr:class I SAM-dependent methyltransferase [Neobacillus vireti]ETI70796.1 ubiquinone/menaquinone biosynthesis methyltransferase UbiE [Neobacillus vireti LMG 21834]KLT17663.1 methyltransferase [Neobacillus vireti]